MDAWEKEIEIVLLLTFREGIYSFEAWGLAGWRDAVKFQRKTWSVAHDRPCRFLAAERIYFLLLSVYVHVRHQRVHALASANFEKGEEAIYNKRKYISIKDEEVKARLW